MIAHLVSPRLWLATLFIVLLVAGTSCQKSKTGAGQINACNLISQEEIQSIQGAPVKEVKSSASTNGGFQTADCLYTSAIDSYSVSIALVQKNSGSPDARDPKEYWKTSFSRYAKQTGKGDADNEKTEEAAEREEAEKSAVPPPKKIEDLGDGAFWATSINGGGALFVLKGNAFIRISVAGSESEESKIDQSKALAAKALARF